MPGSATVATVTASGILAPLVPTLDPAQTALLVLAIGDLAFLGASSYATFLLASLVLGFGDFFAASQMAAVSEAVPAHSRGRVLAAYRFSVDIGATGCLGGDRIGGAGNLDIGPT